MHKEFKCGWLTYTGGYRHSEEELKSLPEDYVAGYKAAEESITKAKAEEDTL